MGGADGSGYPNRLSVVIAECMLSAIPPISNVFEYSEKELSSLFFICKTLEQFVCESSSLKTSKRTVESKGRRGKQPRHGVILRE